MRYCFDELTLILTSNSILFPCWVFFFSMQENELKLSVRSNWKMYSGCGHCSPSVCLCVGVWVCVCVCLSVDSGALMLKDVSSFLHGTGLLWRSCWAALMSRMCHCRTFSSETTAGGDQNGMFILSVISTLSLLLCHSLPVTHSFTVWYTLNSLFLSLCTTTTTIQRDASWGEKAATLLGSA